jgi:ATP-dependent phosphoenolpyruvate carboxykinase
VRQDFIHQVIDRATVLLSAAAAAAAAAAAVLFVRIAQYECYMTSSTSIVTSLAHKEIVILGTQYAGESKKGIWT